MGLAYSMNVTDALLDPETLFIGREARVRYLHPGDECRSLREVARATE
jgi:hypothetical protein